MGLSLSSLWIQKSAHAWMGVLSIVGSLSCQCARGGAGRDRPESRSAAGVRPARRAAFKDVEKVLIRAN
ncbi:hypothetical protein AB0O34_21060 [Sphaerisporangium sp. NPDC088356]|uniref:hypothetical protein n=1 Tax=Sphaerisporangium sp. NPDC088356 TaxID=3154871 RepID=UPI00343C1DC0